MPHPFQGPHSRPAPRHTTASNLTTPTTAAPWTGPQKCRSGSRRGESEHRVRGPSRRAKCGSGRLAVGRESSRLDARSKQPRTHEHATQARRTEHARPRASPALGRTGCPLGRCAPSGSALRPRPTDSRPAPDPAEHRPATAPWHCQTAGGLACHAPPPRPRNDSATAKEGAKKRLGFQFLKPAKKRPDAIAESNF